MIRSAVSDPTEVSFSEMPSRFGELVHLSRRLGDPAADMAILAEGNTSCTDDPGFWVKASGVHLGNISEDGFVRCDRQTLTGAIGSSLSDDQVKHVLQRSILGESSESRMPSVEAFMHAWLLGLPNVNFVGHVHPTAILALVSSPAAQQLCRMRFFPDEVVCCGRATAWVPYVDPGLPLAEKIADSVSAFVRDHGEHPRVIWLQNHGVITIGSSAQEVESALAMTVKSARVILMAGGLQAVEKDRLVPLSPQVVERIHTRPDEHYRQAALWRSGVSD